MVTGVVAATLRLLGAEALYVSSLVLSAGLVVICLAFVVGVAVAVGAIQPESRE